MPVGPSSWPAFPGSLASTAAGAALVLAGGNAGGAAVGEAVVSAAGVGVAGVCSLGFHACEVVASPALVSPPSLSAGCSSSLPLSSPSAVASARYCQI